MKRCFLLACFLLPPLAAIGQGGLEVIALKHRSAEQVIPVLRPLLESGGVLSGQGYQLIVRTSARNLEDIRTTLAAIDTPQRRLMVSVRFDARADAAGSAIDVRGTLRSGDATLGNRPFVNERVPAAGQSQVEARVLSGRSATDERVDQRVQVLEGGRAFISTGQSRTLPQRQVFSGPAGALIQDSSVIHEAASGFEVMPRLSGNTVFLDISPRRQQFTDSGSSGTANVPAQVVTHRTSSGISARLGEWVELGGANESASQASSGILSSRATRSSEARRVWVKVEELRP